MDSRLRGNDNREDADDVVQETFLAAYRALPEFRGDARFSTWLHRIALTRALNYLDRAEEKRSRHALPLRGGSSSGGEDDPPERAAVDPVDRSPSPLRSLDARELARRLAECFERLPAAWRAVIALRDGQEQSYDEIAELLGIALGTVRSRLARARLALRSCVEGEAP